MLLTDQDSGRTVEIRAGAVLTVRLKENPTMGYRWTVDEAGNLERMGDRFEVDGAIGAGGVRIFQFRASRVGSCELSMKNCREWEAESSVIDRFDAKIIVR